MDSRVFDEMVSSGTERGETGLVHSGGQILEDSIPELHTLSAKMRTFNKMMRDSTIRTMLFVVEMHLRGVRWKVDPGGDRKKDEFRADFIEHNLYNMKHSWQDFISEVLSMLPFGFSLHEIVYGKDAKGRVRWYKLPIRSQDSVHEWIFDSKGDLKGFLQKVDFSPRDVFIPSEKFLLFRTTSYKNNPQGRAILEAAYRPWYFKQKLEVIEAIGLERDLTGYPKLTVPEDLFSENALAKAQRAYAENIVTRVRKDEQMGAVLPSGWELELLSAPGAQRPNTSEVVERYDLRIAQSVLADIAMLGHKRGGSYALGEVKYEMFVTVLQAWADSIAEVLNRDAVPRLMRLNGWEAPYPVIRPERIVKIEPQKLSNVLFRLAGIDALRPDDKMEKFLRDFIGLPNADEATSREEKEDPRYRPDNDKRPADTTGQYVQKGG